MSLNRSAKDHKNTSQPAGLKRSRTDAGNKVTVVLGAQWGDEGKGKVVDLLATEADVVCRCQVHVRIRVFRRAFIHRDGCVSCCFMPFVFPSEFIMKCGTSCRVKTLVAP